MRSGRNGAVSYLRPSLSLLAADQDDPAAASLARGAVATAEAHRISFEPLSGIVYLALGWALARQGELSEAEVQLRWSFHLAPLSPTGGGGDGFEPLACAE